MSRLEKLHAIPNDCAYMVTVGRNLVDVRCAGHGSGDQSLLIGGAGGLRLESVEMMDGIAAMQRHNLRFHGERIEA